MNNVTIPISIGAAAVFCFFGGWILATNDSNQSPPVIATQPVAESRKLPEPTPLAKGVADECLMLLTKQALSRDVKEISEEEWRHATVLFFVPMISVNNTFDIAEEYETAKSMFEFDIEAEAKEMIRTKKFMNPHFKAKADAAQRDAASQPE